MTERQTLPVVPLRGTVIFPGVTVPVAIGRETTLRAVEAASRGDQLVFAVAQRENIEKPTPQHLYQMGVVAKISQMQRTQTGVQLLLEGEARATAIEFRPGDDYMRAVVLPVREVPPPDAEDSSFVALHEELRARAGELAKKRGVPDQILAKILQSVTDPGAFVDLAAGYLELPTEERQALLELTVLEDRMRKVLVQIQRMLSQLEAREEIQSQVQQELGDRQRELFLREQLKAIQKQLGEGDAEDQTEQLRTRLLALELPEEARVEVNRELSRLERTGRDSAEGQVIRTYLEWIAEMPWNTRTSEELDVKRAEQVLNADHYGLEDVKNRVLEFLAVRQLHAAQPKRAQSDNGTSQPATPDAQPEKSEARGDATPAAGAASNGTPSDNRGAPTGEQSREVAKGPILLFIGPPGVGKTSIGKSIARALGRKYVRLALGGVRDEADIRGHRRTYIGAMPGRIAQALKQAGTRNPVILLDEVDKLGVSYQGKPAAALLEVLDPAQNNSFTDHYLNVPFDLSEVLFIATANFIEGIPAPLLDRMEVVEFAGYTER
jgi:ATP-dependent Lon protease